MAAMPIFTVLNPQSDDIPTIPHEVKIEDAVSRYGEALELFSYKDFEQARAIFEELLVELGEDDYDSTNYSSEISRTKQLRYLVHKNFSQLLNRCNESSLAIEQAELALSVKHCDAYLWYELGNLLLNAHRLPEAVCAFMNGLNLSLSKLISTNCLKGICEGLFNMGDFETCLIYAEKAIEMNPGYLRGIWIRNQILDEYSKCAEFSLRHSTFTGDILSLYKLTNVLNKRTNIDDQLNLIKENDSEYFKIVTRDRLMSRQCEEDQDEAVEYITIEVPERSLFRLGVCLFDELTRTLELHETSRSIKSPFPLIKIKSLQPSCPDIKSECFWGDERLSTDNGPVTMPVDDAEVTLSAQKLGICPANNMLMDIPDVEAVPTMKNGLNFQRSRRASKRLEGRNARPMLSDHENNEKIEDVISILADLRCNIDINPRVFCSEADNIDTVISDIYLNMLSPPQNTQSQVEKKGSDDFNLKYDNKRYNDENMYIDFVEAVSGIDCDIIHIARMYCLFAVTECVSLSNYVNYNSVNERKWQTGTKENIVKILTTIEVSNMGLHFWMMMQTSEKDKNSLFAFILSLSEILSDFQDHHLTQDCQNVYGDAKRTASTYINSCTCPKCLLNKYLDTLKLIVAEYETPKSLLLRFYWLLARNVEILNGGCILDAEDLDTANQMYSNCLYLINTINSDEPILTYSKSPNCITQCSLNNKLLSMEVRGYCHTLTHLGTESPQDYLEKLHDLYIVNPSTENPEANQRFRSMFNREASENTKFELLGTLCEACIKFDLINDKMITLSCVFTRSITFLCSSKSISSWMQICITSSKHLLEHFERFDYSKNKWIEVLRAKQAILNNGECVSLLDFFLNSCYVLGNVAFLLVKSYDTWVNSKKNQHPPYSKLIESFCITALRMMVFLVAYNLFNENSKLDSSGQSNPICTTGSVILNFMSSIHQHISPYNLCTAADGEFLLGMVALLKSFGTCEHIDHSKEKLNQCYRCLYGAYIKDIRVEDHQTHRQKLTDSAALDLFFQISKAVEINNSHTSKSTFQDYTELLAIIGEVLEKKITCKKAIISYNISILERVLTQPQTYTYPLKKININFFTFPLEELESDDLREFFKNFYYIFGEAAKRQVVCRRSPIQLVNPEKTVSVLDLALKHLSKSLCIIPTRWKAWMHLGDCYSTLENECLGRSASYVIKNWDRICDFRLRAFNSFLVALQLCKSAINESSDEESRRNLSEELSRIWGHIGKLCYNVYDLPSIHPHEVAKCDEESRISRLTHNILELKLKKFGFVDEGMGSGGDFSFGINLGSEVCNTELSPSRLHEDTVARTRIQERYYHELRRLIMEEDEKINSINLKRRGRVNHEFDNTEHLIVFTALENCYPFARSKGILKLVAHALKQAISFSHTAKNNWQYYMLLGNASYILGAANNVVIDYYLNSILLSSKEVFARDQEIILEPYIELINYICTSYITKSITLHELEDLKKTLLETDNRVFQVKKPPSKVNDDNKTPEFIEPFVENDSPAESIEFSNIEDNMEKKPTSEANPFDIMNELVSRVRIEDKKGWHHEYIYLTCVLYYFVKGDVEAAKDELKNLLKLHRGKSKGFLNIWITDYERPANIFLCTLKYLTFSLLLFEHTGDVKLLRKLIKKLNKSPDKLLWANMINERALNACINYLNHMINNVISKDCAISTEGYFSVTTNNEIVENLAFAISKVVSPDFINIIEALCLAFEVGEYLTVSPGEILNSIQLQIYTYFIGKVLAEANNIIQSSSDNSLISAELQESAKMIMSFFVECGPAPDDIQKAKCQVLQFSRILTRSTAVLILKHSQ